MANVAFLSESLLLQRTDNKIKDDLKTADRTAVKTNLLNIKEIEPIRYSRLLSSERIGQDLSISSNNHMFKSINYGDDFIFERIWVYPDSFDIGFITEDLDYEVKIWNAYKYKSVQTTEVLVTNQEGTFLDYPNLPDTIAQFGDTIYTLYIYRVGPPVQNTTYLLIIDNVEFEITITGIRIIPWDLDANWDSNLQIIYEFITTIYSNEKLTEQRRSLSKESWINIRGSFDVSSSNARKIHNLIAYGKDKIFGVPVYSEKLTPTVLSEGSTSITVSEDFTYYYNLINNGEYVVIVDHINALAEIKLVSSIDTISSQINLHQPVFNDFNVKTTYIYPCVFCVIRAYSSNMQTNNFDEIKIDFREFKSG